MRVHCAFKYIILSHAAVYFYFSNAYKDFDFICMNPDQKLEVSILLNL